MRTAVNLVGFGCLVGTFFAIGYDKKTLALVLLSTSTAVGVALSMGLV